MRWAILANAIASGTSIPFGNSSKISNSLLLRLTQTLFPTISAHNYCLAAAPPPAAAAEAHAHFLKLGIVHRDVLLTTQLLTGYLNYGAPNSIATARKLFDQASVKDTVLCSAMIAGYAQTGHYVQALHLFAEMLQTEDHHHHLVRPNHFVFSTVIRACGATGALQQGLAVHATIVKSGFQANVAVGTAMLSMYSEFFDINGARQLFDEMPQRNRVSWNAMLAGYAANGGERAALLLFCRMTKSCSADLKPDEFAVATALTAVAGIADISAGLQIHGYVVTSGLESDLPAGNALINMYFKCGRIEDAETAYQNMLAKDRISFRLMITGYISTGMFLEGVKFFCQIREGGFMEVIDSTVIVSLLSVCSNLSLLRLGRQIHALTITSIHPKKQTPYFADDFKTTTVTCSILDMYCKCHSINEAQLIFNNMQRKHISHWNALIAGYIHNDLLETALKLFDEMPERNVISWTAVIAGHVQSGLPLEGLRLLTRMYNEDEGTRANSVTFAIVLTACALLTAHHIGKEIHAQAIRTMAEEAVGGNVVVGTALIDMYAKSGNLNCARKVFDRVERKNVVCWTSMIAGYAGHGYGSQAVGLFREMVEMGLKPNEVTFIAALSACSHCGLVEEGTELFNAIKEYGIRPGVDHYACMVDLLGRAGKLSEARSLIEEMEGRGLQGNGGVWGALLGGCKLYGDVEMGRWVARRMLEREYQVGATYVMLSNVYAAAGMWDEVFKVRGDWRRETGEVKEPGRSQLCR